jgi:hypothetical protein
MGNDSTLANTLVVTCCCGSIGGFLFLTVALTVLTLVVGKRRARMGMRLPRRRKGFAGVVGQVQKMERARIKYRQRAEKQAARNRWIKASISVGGVRELTPTQFERYVCKIFERMGCQVQHTGQSSDGGIDLIVSRNEKRAVVQCKRYGPDNRIPPSVVRDLCGAMVMEKADYAFLVTTSTFTQKAIEQAEKDPRIFLIGVERLNQLIQKWGLPEVEDGECSESSQLTPEWPTPPTY